jgi:hypothetical protein
MCRREQLLKVTASLKLEMCSALCRSAIVLSNLLASGPSKISGSPAYQGIHELNLQSPIFLGYGNDSSQTGP